MNIKLKLSSKLIILALSLFLFTNNSNVFSQNISFDELLNLQKEKKKNIITFFKEKAWVQDTKTNNKWIYKKDITTDNVDAIFTLQDKNCNQNIINYIMSDSSIYNKLKDSFLKLSLKHNIINYLNNRITDIYFKDISLRFYETHNVNQLPFYTIWIFSKTDIRYFGELNNYCFQKQNIDKTEKPIRLTWFCDKDGSNPYFKDSKDALKNVSPPIFPGGDFERINFMEKNVRYPRYSNHKKKNYNGIYTCIVNIEKDGSISDVKIPLEDDEEFDESVINDIKSMPRWIPAIENGNPIRVELYMSIWFKPNNDIRRYNNDDYIPTITLEN